MPAFLPRLGRLAPEDDAALLQRLAAGDAQALERLYRRECGPVYRYALALCGNPGWSADAVQDAFMQLLQRPAGFDAARGTLGAYLAGIVRHRLLAQWREPLQPAEDEAAAPPDDASAETLLVRRQQGDALWRALRALPWVFREAVVLVDLQERPYAEAAAIAGVELNTLRTRLHRARQRLARALGDEGEMA